MVLTIGGISEYKYLNFENIYKIWLSLSNLSWSGNISPTQISKRQVPVSGLLRPNAVGNLCSVNHSYQPMEISGF